MARKTVTIDEATWRRLNAAKDPMLGEPRKESTRTLQFDANIAIRKKRLRYNVMCPSKKH